MTKLDYKLDTMSDECEKAEPMKNTNGDNHRRVLLPRDDKYRQRKVVNGGNR